MPLYKVWNADRTKKVFLMASTVEDVKMNGAVKLKLKPCTHFIDLRLVLESDGTSVDEDEILLELKKETLMLLETGDIWQIPAIELQIVNPQRPEPLDVTQPSLPLTSLSSSTASSLSSSTSSTTSTETNETLRESSMPCQQLVSPGTSSNSSKRFTVPLPKLSSYVEESLAAGRIIECFTNLVSECAHFYINTYDLTTPSQYREVGVQLYRRYPCIKFPKGTEPWALFCEKLSQKLRNMRFQLRRKSGEVATGGKSPKQPRFARSFSFREVQECLSTEDYDKHLQELASETKKATPNKEHIKLLLKETLKMRRDWLSTQPIGCWAPLMASYPCFEDIGQVVFEFGLLMRHTGGLEDEENNINALFSIVEKTLEKAPQGSDDVKSIHLLREIEKRTAFEKGKGRKSETILVVKKDVPEEDIEKSCASKELSPPSLLGFMNGENLMEIVIIGDGQKIFCRTRDVKKALLYLVLLYYITDLQYPRQYSQILGLVQNYVIKEQFNCAVSSKYIHMCSILEKEMGK